MNHIEYLLWLEEMGEKRDLDSAYLWPRTEIKNGSMQEKIARICGASDWENSNPLSRSYHIIKCINALLSSGDLPEYFNALDITCGDAVVLLQLKQAFPGIEAFGLDCLKDQFITHDECYRHGVRIFKGYLQDIFSKANIHEGLPVFDLVVMLNTYRGWESADLREDEKDIPKMADSFFAKHAKHTIITVVDRQIPALEESGFQVLEIGPGESGSKMVLIKHHSDSYS